MSNMILWIPALLVLILLVMCGISAFGGEREPKQFKWAQKENFEREVKSTIQKTFTIMNTAHSQKPAPKAGRKLDPELISELAAGKIIVRNDDGTIKELNQILLAAFPGTNPSSGIEAFYGKDRRSKVWRSWNFSPGIKPRSIEEFFQQLPLDEYFVQWVDFVDSDISEMAPERKSKNFSCVITSCGFPDILEHLRSWEPAKLESFKSADKILVEKRKPKKDE